MKTIKIIGGIGESCLVVVSILAAAYLGLIATAAALIGMRAGVSNGHEATQVADVDLVRVRGLEQTLPQKLGSPVGNLAVPLHLAKSQTAIAAGGK